MAITIDTELVHFDYHANLILNPIDPDSELEETALVIKAYLQDDSAEDEDEDEDYTDLQNVAVIQMLSLSNYEQSDIYLFDCFDAHSQLACNSFEHINFYEDKNIIEKTFLEGVPIVCIMSIDIKEKFLGNEKQIIQLISSFIKKRFGNSYLSFGLASQFCNYNDQREPVNKDEMVTALKQDGYTIVDASKGLQGSERVIPVFKYQY